MPRTILLNPGPVTLSDRVRAALTAGDWCHREPEFAELTKSINTDLLRVYSAMEDEFDAVTMTGSGTCAVEAMLSTFAPAAHKTLVVANGVYGERMARMLAAQKKPHEIVQSAWVSPMDLESVRIRLEKDKSIACVVAVHHETTTGRLNDVEELGRICREFGVNLLLDAVSSFGAERIDALNWNISAIAATANKCLHGVPGLSFVLAHKSLWNEPAGGTGSVYLDLSEYHDGQHGAGYSPFTQSVQVAFALKEALSELRDNGGWSQRRDLYRARANQINDALSDVGVAPVLRPQDYSCVLRSYNLPAGSSYARIHDSLKADGYVIYAGQGDFASTSFRIANMGDIRDVEIQRLCDALKTLLVSRTA